MQSIFGRNGQRALALITRLARLSAKEVNEVADAWSQGSALNRGRAWAQLVRASTEQERYRILAAGPRFGRHYAALTAPLTAAPPALAPTPDRPPDDAADQWPAPYILR
jgi:hypothetical protein